MPSPSVRRTSSHSSVVSLLPLGSASLTASTFFLPLRWAAGAIVHVRRLGSLQHCVRSLELKIVRIDLGIQRNHANFL